MKSKLLLLLAVLALVATACGGDDADDTTTAAPGDGGATTTAAPAGDVAIEMARFFGDCAEATEGVTDVNQATTECEVVQILINAFNAEDNGVTVAVTGGQAWDTYYTQLSTTFAAGNPPAVAVMHDYVLPDYASRNLLRQLDDDLGSAGIDFSDYTDLAQQGAQYEGGTYSVPFDVHGSLWHMNVDIFEEAGLVDGDGNPILPGSPQELLQQCATVQETTGKQYFAHDWFEFGVGARMFLGLVAQQGGNIVDASGTPTIDTPEGRAALDLMNQLATECSNPEQGYTDSQAAFLKGDVAALHNGTWVVNQYANEAGFTYRVTSLPPIFGSTGSWGSAHMWVLPDASNEDPTVLDASLKFVKYMYDSIGDWSRMTGHLANRTSILESSEWENLPQRANYADVADTAVFVPGVPNWSGAWDALAEELNATWVSGKDQGAALADAEARMTEELS